MELVHTKTAKVDIEDLFGEETVSDLFIVGKTTTEKEVTTTTTTTEGSSTPVERSSTAQRQVADTLPLGVSILQKGSFFRFFGFSVEM